MYSPQRVPRRKFKCLYVLNGARAGGVTSYSGVSTGGAGWEGRGPRAVGARGR